MKEKLYRFMVGRYGNDTLNVFLLIVYVLLSLLCKRNSILYYVGFGLFIFAFYRSMSRNIYKRRQENEMFLNLIKPIKPYINATKRNFTDKQRKYFVCPSCKQVIRVPRHRGKIEISCPTCHSRFVRKS